MSLENYFTALIQKVESSDHVTNAGKDKNGFYKPTRSIVLRNLQLLKDLHGKPRASSMVKAAWEIVSAELPADWLILELDDKMALAKILNVSQ